MARSYHKSTFLPTAFCRTSKLPLSLDPSASWRGKASDHKICQIIFRQTLLLLTGSFHFWCMGMYLSKNVDTDKTAGLSGRRPWSDRHPFSKEFFYHKVPPYSLSSWNDCKWFGAQWRWLTKQLRQVFRRQRRISRQLNTLKTRSTFRQLLFPSIVLKVNKMNHNKSVQVSKYTFLSC